MSEKPRLYSHNSVYRPNCPSYSLDEIRDEFLPDLEETGLVATDMDGTMFRNDLGKLVFLEKLSTAPDWILDPGDFAELLVPDTYTVILNLAHAGRLPDICSDDAEKYKRLSADCVELYTAIYSAEDQDFTIEHPLVNEFARKMLELDRMGMEMEHIFIEGNDGQLLSRTRFFVNWNRRKIAKLTEAAMTSHQNGSRFAHLQVHPENRRVINQRVGADELEAIDYDKKVVVVEGVRQLIATFFNDGQGVPVRIVTTNLRGIAEGALKASPYRDLLIKQDCDGKSPILASKLESSVHGTMGTRFKKKPIFGEVKATKLRELEATLQRQSKTSGKKPRKTRVVFGDSVSNDAAMWTLGLENGGIAVIVGRPGEKYESIRARVQEPFIDGEEGVRRTLGDEDVGKRIFYLEDIDKQVD